MTIEMIVVLKNESMPTPECTNPKSSDIIMMDFVIEYSFNNKGKRRPLNKISSKIGKIKIYEICPIIE